MKWLLRIVVGLLVVMALGLGALFATGNGALIGLTLGIAFGAPSDPFDPADAEPPPDYADPVNWAALLSTVDLSDSMPVGIEGRALAAPVDVFFIHPTGYLKGTTWTSPMDPASVTEENTQWMLINQASAYNGCCNVYAPRYREASIFSYFGDAEQRARVLGFAYQDVELAFDYFLEHFNKGERPFIVASHSQGTHHGVVLLRERIDGTPLAKRMVAAYLIGGGINESEFAGMKDIDICDAPDEVGCALHWDTMSERASSEDGRAGNVCVNPLTWRRDGEFADSTEHVGAVPVSGRFQVDFQGSDAATGMKFPPLAAPVAHHVSARCENGMLYVTHQDGVLFEPGLGLPVSTNYHGLDYPLFHMDIRENALLRVQTYQEAH